jgi:glucose-6-phosphate isomerase
MTLTTTQSCLQRLKAHRETFKNFRLKEAFTQDSLRFNKYSFDAADLFLDYSKNFITSDTISLWCSFLKGLDLPKEIEAYFSGKKINYTENRAVLHTALRYFGKEPICVDGHNIIPEIKTMRHLMKKIVEAVHSGTWRGYSGERITDVVNIGIGGSDLGPEMVYQALLPYKSPQINTHFISNLDLANLQTVLKPLSPKTTLFIVVSKSFTTQETLTNAKRAKKWLLESDCSEAMTHRHFIAVSSQVDKAVEFGIQKENILPMWDWVGGRFSLWSAVGLSIALSIGMSNFEELLRGAYTMDEHFRSASFEENMPVILGILSAWYINFFDAETFCLLPYSYYLRLLPSYLQQASMESLGKSINNDGKKVNYSTGAILWGGAGTNTQHSFHQLLFQGTHFVPIDFILPLSNLNDSVEDELPLIAHCLGQSQLFMQGYSEEQNLKELLSQGMLETRAKYLAKYKAIDGNSPNNMLLLKTLSPKTLGALIALYEHKIFVESIIWRINAYDQWGVERGKKLAKQLLADLNAKKLVGNYDPSTLGLIHRIQSELPKK